MVGTLFRFLFWDGLFFRCELLVLGRVLITPWEMMMSCLFLREKASEWPRTLGYLQMYGIHWYQDEGYSFPDVKINILSKKIKQPKFEEKRSRIKSNPTKNHSSRRFLQFPYQSFRFGHPGFHHFPSSSQIRQTHPPPSANQVPSNFFTFFRPGLTERPVTSVEQVLEYMKEVRYCAWFSPKIFPRLGFPAINIHGMEVGGGMCDRSQEGNQIYPRSVCFDAPLQVEELYLNFIYKDLLSRYLNSFRLIKSPNSR